MNDRSDNSPPQPLCHSCRYWVPMDAVVAGQRKTVMHCQQGCRDHGHRMQCPAYEREPGADDE